jgi:hypothetical protein
MKKPHKHAEAIKAWAEGSTVQCRMKLDGGWTNWRDVEYPRWDADEYRIKPEPPKYPQTNMGDPELVELWRQCVVASGPFTDHHLNALRSFANAAIVRAIEDEQVLINEAYHPF